VKVKEMYGQVQLWQWNIDDKTKSMSMESECKCIWLFQLMLASSVQCSTMSWSATSANRPALHRQASVWAT